MWIVLTWISLSFANPSGVHGATAADDSTRSWVQDTVKSNDSGIPPKSILRQVRPYLNTNAPIDRPQESHVIEHSGTTLGTLTATHPHFKASLLKELLLRAYPVTHFIPTSPAVRFNQQLAQCTRLTPFERMGLVAHWYNLCYPLGKSLKDHQIDILRTIRWL